MTIVGTFPTTISNGQIEDATVVMSLFSYIQSQVNGNACAATTGTTLLKGDGAGNTTVAVAGTDYMSGIGAQQQTANWCGTATGTANAIILTPTPAVTTLVTGMVFEFIAAYAPTATTVTVTVGTASAVNLIGSAVQGMAAGQIYRAVYDGTAFELTQISVTDIVRTNVASATTTVLPNTTRSLIITGTTPITSFTVNQGLLYFVVFQSSGLVITNNSNITTNSGTNIITLAGDSCIIRALSATQVEIVNYSTQSPPSMQGASKALVCYAQGGFANIYVSAESVTLRSYANTYVTLYGISLAETTGGTPGNVNSLDTGTWAFSTWYYIHVVYGTSGTGLLYSLSETSPTLPTGYTYFARVGSFKTQAATNYYPLGFTQYGRDFQFRGTLPTISSGTQGSVATPTYVSVATGLPATAAKVKLINQFVTSSTGSVQMIAPNGNYGAYGAASQPPSILLQAGSSGAMSQVAEFVLESSNVYVASNNSGAQVQVLGFTDNL